MKIISNLSFIGLAILLLFSCKKDSDEESSHWGDKYTGNYSFTTFYHDATYTVYDTIQYNGFISVQDETSQIIKIVYLPDHTIYPHVADDSTLEMDNGGSHSDFSGKIEINGSIEFRFYHYWESWHVIGTKL